MSRPFEDDGVIWQDDQGRGRKKERRKEKRGGGPIPLEVVHGLADGLLDTCVP